MKKDGKRVLVYLKAGSPSIQEEVFLDNLGKPYTCRNSQFFRDIEGFDEVYNLANCPKIVEAYGDKIVPVDVKPKAKEAPKKVETANTEVVTEEVKAEAPKRKPRASTTRGENK